MGAITATEDPEGDGALTVVGASGDLFRPTTIITMNNAIITPRVRNIMRMIIFIVLVQRGYIWALLQRLAPRVRAEGMATMSIAHVILRSAI
jgi:hypothetical protein